MKHFCKHADKLALDVYTLRIISCHGLLDVEFNRVIIFY